MSFPKTSYVIFCESKNSNSDYGLFIETDGDWICIWQHGELILMSRKQFKQMIKAYNNLFNVGLI